MAAPSVRSVGIRIVTTGVAVLDPANMPPGWQEDDIFLMVIETSDEAVTPPSGWAHISGSPVSQPNGDATRLTVLWRRATASESPPTIADPGNHICARVAAIQGCVTTGNPWDVTAAGTEDTADTSISVPGATTTGDERLVLAASSSGLDQNIEGLEWANPDLQGVAEMVYEETNLGNGGSFGIASGVKATVGTYGPTTAEWAVGSSKALMSIALLPDPIVPGSATLSATGTLTTDANILAAGAATLSGEATLTAKASGRITSAARLPLGLAVEVETASGEVYRWDGDSAERTDRPLDVQFRTENGEGFGDASIKLSREITQDWPDLNLLDTVRLVAQDGSVVYEGRHAANPRTIDEEGHSITLETAGWSAHLRDKPIQVNYLDRGLERWVEPSRQQRINILGGGQTIRYEPAEEVADPTGGLPGLQFNVQGKADTGDRIRTEQYYDAGENLEIADLYYSWKKTGPGAAGDLSFEVHIADDDIGTNAQSSGDRVGSDTGAEYLSDVITPTPARWAFMQWRSTANFTKDNQDRLLHVSDLAVYGNTGMERHGAGDPQGYLASDLVRDVVERAAPRLSTDGIEQSDFVVEHATWPEPTEPYSILEELNTRHAWLLAVWEGPTFHFGPADLTDYDWEVRLDEPGFSGDLQGDSTDELVNGVVVTFEDVKLGKLPRVLLPTDYDELRDDSRDNPLNRHGIERWGEPIEVPHPDTEGGAIRIGQIALEESNRAKSPGRITVSGYIRDRSGHEQPVWKVRAGDALVISNHPNDRPRLITDTTYTHDGRQLEISLEQPSSRLEALLARVALRRAEAGLG